MESLYWILPLALLLPAIWAIKVVLVARALLGLRVAPDRLRPVDASGVPPHEREAARPAIAGLEALGFSVRQICLCEDPNGPEFTTSIHELVHASEPIRAYVHLHARPDRFGQSWVEFATTLADGREVSTRSHDPETTLPVPPEFLREVVAGGIPGVLQAHRARVAALASAGARAELPDAASTIRRAEALTASAVEILRQSGAVFPRPDGCLAWRLLPALRAAATLVQGERRRRRLAKESASAPGSPPLSDDARLEFAWDGYRRLAALKRGRVPWLPKAVIALGSLAAFALALGWQVSPRTAVLLIATLVVHECGHLAGMWCFGFRDTQLLFLPFLGAAAIRSDTRILSPAKHLVILFLGPLPGLLAGFAFLVLAPGVQGWPREAAVMAVALNAFNLLPILPLDGGQIFAVALADRFPRLRALFLAASGAGLVLLGLLAPGLILIAVIGGIILFQLPVAWRSAGLVRAIRRQNPPGAEEAAVVRQILRAFLAGPWQGVPPARRLVMARELQEQIRRPVPRFGTVALAVAGYLSPVWVVIPAAIWRAQVAGDRHLQDALARAEAAGIPPRWERPAYASVPEGENAAVPVARALELTGTLEESDESPDLTTPDRPVSADPVGAEIIRLLRDAAARPRFVWKTDKAGDPGELYRQVRLVALLVSEARAQLRIRQRSEALSVTRDGLRLVRRLTDDPGWWTLSSHVAATEGLWDVAEQCLAEGAALPPEAYAELAGLADEDALLRFAPRAFAIERGLVLRAFADRMAGGPDARIPWATRILLAAMGGGSRDWPVQYLDDSIDTHRLIQQAAAGQWSDEVLELAKVNSSTVEVANLATLVARLRQARAALAIGWQQAATGVRPQRFEDLTAPWWHGAPCHPMTGRSLRWQTVGAAEMLEFEAGQRRPKRGRLETPGCPGWRLPERG